MANINNTGNDAIALNEFARKVERLCRYSDISILLYRNRDGMFLSEIMAALNLKSDEIDKQLDILVRDDMVDEDRVRQHYMLGDTAVDIFDLNSNDSTITLESRLSEIANRLELYAIATDAQEKEKCGKRITSYLYDTYNKTVKELKQLKIRVENEYKMQKDLRYKSQMLSVYIRQIEEIMYSLDVQRPAEHDTDGTKKVYRNLKQMLRNDEHYGRDYVLSIDGFFKNCDAKLSNQILELYELFLTWWGKTKVALKDFRGASAALDALIHYNPGNAALKDVVENPPMPLPPVSRHHARVDAEDDNVGLEPPERIMSMADVNADDYNMISQCCAVLHYDFVNFKTVEDQPIPEAMLLDEQPVLHLAVVDTEEEIRQFREYDGTLLQFLRSRYPSMTDNEILRLFMKTAISTGDKPMIFDEDYNAELVDEHFNDKYDIITVTNSPTRKNVNE